MIVECSKYPISIIIIGVGSDRKFSKMKELDADKGGLKNSSKVKSERDLV